MRGDADAGALTSSASPSASPMQTVKPAPVSSASPSPTPEPSTSPNFLDADLDPFAALKCSKTPLLCALPPSQRGGATKLPLDTPCSPPHGLPPPSPQTPARLPRQSSNVHSSQMAAHVDTRTRTQSQHSSSSYGHHSSQRHAASDANAARTPVSTPSGTPHRSRRSSRHLYDDDVGAARSQRSLSAAASGVDPYAAGGNGGGGADESPLSDITARSFSLSRGGRINDVGGMLDAQQRHELGLRMLMIYDVTNGDMGEPVAGVEIKVDGSDGASLAAVREVTSQLVTSDFDFLDQDGAPVTRNREAMIAASSLPAEIMIYPRGSATTVGDLSLPQHVFHQHQQHQHQQQHRAAASHSPISPMSPHPSALNYDPFEDDDDDMRLPDVMPVLGGGVGVVAGRHASSYTVDYDANAAHFYNNGGGNGRRSFGAYSVQSGVVRRPSQPQLQSQHQFAMPQPQPRGSRVNTNAIQRNHTDPGIGGVAGFMTCNTCSSPTCGGTCSSSAHGIMMGMRSMSRGGGGVGGARTSVGSTDYDYAAHGSPSFALPASPPMAAKSMPSAPPALRLVLAPEDSSAGGGAVSSALASPQVLGYVEIRKPEFTLTDVRKACIRFQKRMPKKFTFMLGDADVVKSDEKLHKALDCLPDLWVRKGAPSRRRSLPGQSLRVLVNGHPRSVIPLSVTRETTVKDLREKVKSHLPPDVHQYFFLQSDNNRIPPYNEESEMAIGLCPQVRIQPYTEPTPEIAVPRKHKSFRRFRRKFFNVKRAALHPELDFLTSAADNERSMSTLSERQYNECSISTGSAMSVGSAPGGMMAYHVGGNSGGGNGGNSRGRHRATASMGGGHRSTASLGGGGKESSSTAMLLGLRRSKTSLDGASLRPPKPTHRTHRSISSPLTRSRNNSFTSPPLLSQPSSREDSPNQNVSPEPSHQLSVLSQASQASLMSHGSPSLAPQVSFSQLPPEHSEPPPASPPSKKNSSSKKEKHRKPLFGGKGGIGRFRLKSKKKVPEFTPAMYNGLTTSGSTATSPKAASKAEPQASEGATAASTSREASPTTANAHTPKSLSPRVGSATSKATLPHVDYNELQAAVSSRFQERTEWHASAFATSSSPGAMRPMSVGNAKTGGDKRPPPLVLGSTSPTMSTTPANAGGRPAAFSNASPHSGSSTKVLENPPSGSRSTPTSPLSLHRVVEANSPNAASAVADNSAPSRNAPQTSEKANSVAATSSASCSPAVVVDAAPAPLSTDSGQQQSPTAVGVLQRNAVGGGPGGPTSPSISARGRRLSRSSRSTSRSPTSHLRPGVLSSAEARSPSIDNAMQGYHKRRSDTIGQTMNLKASPTAMTKPTGALSPSSRKQTASMLLHRRRSSLSFMKPPPSPSASSHDSMLGGPGHFAVQKRRAPSSNPGHRKSASVSPSAKQSAGVGSLQAFPTGLAAPAFSMPSAEKPSLSSLSRPRYDPPPMPDAPSANLPQSISAPLPRVVSSPADPHPQSMALTPTSKRYRTFPQRTQTDSGGASPIMANSPTADAAGRPRRSTPLPVKSATMFPSSPRGAVSPRSGGFAALDAILGGLAGSAPSAASPLGGHAGSGVSEAQFREITSKYDGNRIEVNDGTQNRFAMWCVTVEWYIGAAPVFSTTGEGIDVRDAREDAFRKCLQWCHRFAASSGVGSAGSVS